MYWCYPHFKNKTEELEDSKRGLPCSETSQACRGMGKSLRFQRLKKNSTWEILNKEILEYVGEVDISLAAFSLRDYFCLSA